MSLFRTLDRTTSACLTSPANATPFLSFLGPVPAYTIHAPETRRNFSKTAVYGPPRTAAAAGSRDHMEAFFIQALARAGSCPEHARQINTWGSFIPPTLRHHQPRRKGGLLGPQDRREFKSTKAGRVGPFGRIKQFAERELKALVDYYGITLDTRPEELHSDIEGLLVWNVGDDHQPWTLRNPEDQKHVDRMLGLLENEEASHDDLYDAYKQLPSPGVAYLSIDRIRKLLHQLSIVERPSPEVMQRFLSILDDMKKSKIHISRSEWTSAIYFAGRCMGKVSANELQSALYMWRDMEKRAGIKGGPVTLNVLFDVAVKAGKYTIAEAFLKEMQARQLKLHRHFRVSILYYYGVLQNGDAIRRTYQQLVEANEVVDTVVINAVIAALMRAGEPSAAEHVFERMKRLHAKRLHSTLSTYNPTTSNANLTFHPRTWRQNRLLGLHLTYAPHRPKSPHTTEQLQSLAPIAPNSRTYSLILRHHATVTGNLDRVFELLAEMRFSNVPRDGTAYIVLFYGFAKWGGVRYSGWRKGQLERVWQEFMNDAQHEKAKREGDKKDEGSKIWLSNLMVTAILHAFAKCAGRERTLVVWEEVRGLWHPTDSENERILGVLGRVLPPEKPRKIEEKQQPGFFDERAWDHGGGWFGE